MLSKEEIARLPLIVEGMQGLGDSLHQRSVMRELAKEFEVWLETSWPCVYWDMPYLNLIPSGTILRTQQKNIEREAQNYTRKEIPGVAQLLKVSSPPKDIMREGSVLRAMSHVCGVKAGDFRLPMRQEWIDKADALIAELKPTKPILFFRPLVERREWTGGKTRNPDGGNFAELFELIRHRFFVVSIADLEQNKEWLSGGVLQADAVFHRGELDVETLLGLMKRSAMVFGAPGFSTVMAQALEVPGVTVFGGYEDQSSFSSGARYAPWLPIEPIRPCPCWSHTHACRKKIDMPKAIKAMQEFLKVIGC